MLRANMLAVFVGIEKADFQCSLLETGKHSDFVITYGDDTYNVHKSIVCSQSTVLDAATRFGKVSERYSEVFAR